MPKRRDPLSSATSVIPAALQERPRKTSVRKRAADRARSKATYDVPDEIAADVESLATELGCSKSDVAVYALCDLLARYRAGEIEFKSHLRPHMRSPRFAFKLSREKA